MPFLRRKPALFIPDFDLPITTRTPYVRGVAIGTIHTRHPHARKATPDRKDQLEIMVDDPQEIERRIELIRREKELLSRLGRES